MLRVPVPVEPARQPLQHRAHYTNAGAVLSWKSCRPAEVSRRTPVARACRARIPRAAECAARIPRRDLTQRTLTQRRRVAMTHAPARAQVALVRWRLGRGSSDPAGDPAAAARGAS